MSIRRLSIAFCLLASVAVARAEPRLDKVFGRSDRSGAQSFVANRADAPSTAPSENAIAPLRAAMLKFDAARTKALPTSRPTPADRAKFLRALDDRDRAMRAAVESMAGLSGRISFRVVAIRPRPEPIEPRPTDVRLPDHVEIDRRASAEYQRELDTIERQPLVAIGEIALTASAAADAIKVEMQNATIAANRKATDLHRQLSVSTDKSERELLQAALKENDATRADRIAALRKQLDAAWGTDDFVYVFGSAADFRLWQPGQQRAIAGTIDHVRVAVEPFESGDRALEFDAIVTRNENTETRPASDPSAR